MKKKKQDIGEAIRRFKEGPRMGPPKPKPPKPPKPPEPTERPADYYDSPGFQSPEQRKKTQYRP
ncbi:hypothetical protein OA097_00765 [bacterium]|nr:hypothetical protein [bacterium]